MKNYYFKNNETKIITTVVAKNWKDAEKKMGLTLHVKSMCFHFYIGWAASLILEEVKEVAAMY